MKVVIPGGTGQVGTLLTRAFLAAGDDVVILSRHPDAANSRETGQADHPSVGKTGFGRQVAWDGKSLRAWTEEIDGADVVINLAGRSVNCRYHDANRRAIMDSRLQSTRAVGQAIAQASSPPSVWLQASTATIYAHRFDQPNDETTGILGGAEPHTPDTWRFSIDVAKKWEAEAMSFRLPRTRQVLLRSAITLSPDAGGVFDYLLWLVRFRLGGKQGDGRQFVSWIHEFDFYRAVRWLIDNEQLSGPVNLTAPRPLRNADFMCALREAWGARIGLPATRWMLEVGTFLLRSENELILKSRRVVPGLLLGAGFEFEYPEWQPAAEELCQRWRAWRSGNYSQAPQTVGRSSMSASH